MGLFPPPRSMSLPQSWLALLLEGEQRRRRRKLILEPRDMHGCSRGYSSDQTERLEKTERWATTRPPPPHLLHIARCTVVNVSDKGMTKLFFMIIKNKDVIKQPRHFLNITSVHRFKVSKESHIVHKFWKSLKSTNALAINRFRLDQKPFSPFFPFT